MKPRDFIALSRDLAKLQKGRPTQVALRRSVSTAYYALFHCLARCAADLMIGSKSASRSDEAWRQVYRALEHGQCKNACKNGAMLGKFPKAIEDFGNMFVMMQEKRHRADYDPTVKLVRSGVMNDIKATEQVIDAFQLEKISDRRAFAAYVLFKNRV